jgi:hypothetical protein
MLPNAQTAKDMDTQRITAISNHDASNAQVITPHSTVTERNARMMPDVFSVVATILLTTKDAPSTKNSGKKAILTVPNNMFLRLHFNAPSHFTRHNVRSNRQTTNSCYLPATQNPQPPQPAPQNSDMQKLK